MEIHVSERRYKCGECGKLYKTIGHVREHMRAHSDERPYHCTRCNKGYKTKVSFKIIFALYLPTFLHIFQCKPKLIFSFFLRMPCRCIRGLTGMRNLMCVSTAWEASGRKDLWCDTSATTPAKSLSSAQSAIVASPSMGLLIGTCALKVSLLERENSYWSNKELYIQNWKQHLHQEAAREKKRVSRRSLRRRNRCRRTISPQQPSFQRIHTPSWWSSRQLWQTRKSTSSRWATAIKIGMLWSGFLGPITIQLYLPIIWHWRVDTNHEVLLI